MIMSNIAARWTRMADTARAKWVSLMATDTANGDASERDVKSPAAGSSRPASSAEPPVAAPNP